MLPLPLARVVLVTGKGGVGKTTVAAGLAHATAERDGSAVLVELGDGSASARIVAKGSRIERRVVKPEKAIEDMAGGVFGSALLSKVVVGNFAMKRLLRAAPALRELGQLDAIRRIAAEDPRRSVIVDMPATGHGVAWLRVPRQMRALLKGGPLHAVAARLDVELVAKDRCSIVVVSLPERLVLRETLELCASIRNDVGLDATTLVVNRVPPALPAHALSEARRLAGNSHPLAAAAASLVEVIAAREQARGEALSALEEATAGRSFARILLPEAPADPTAAQVARWLVEETS